MNTGSPAFPHTTLAIVGMTCGHCVHSVRRALFSVPGIRIQSVSVGSAVIESPSSETIDAAIAAIREAGYSAMVLPESEPATVSACVCCVPGGAPCR